LTDANGRKRKDLGMNDHGQARPARCGAVWLIATCAFAGLLAWVLPDLAEAGRVLAGAGRLAALPFERLLVWCSAAVAIVGAGWLWAVTTVITLEAARGRTHATAVPGVPVLLRRAVLAGCGVALAGGLTSPALATPGQVHQDRTGSAVTAVLGGLPLPDRATGAFPGAGHAAHREVVVRPGDTLWGLAARELADTAGDAAIAERWHLIYELNRDLIGDDPDAIQPDQRLRLPHP
jgi:nucleoid-associated protein YgaU